MLGHGVSIAVSIMMAVSPVVMGASALASSLYIGNVVVIVIAVVTAVVIVPAVVTAISRHGNNNCSSGGRRAACACRSWNGNKNRVCC